MLPSAGWAARELWRRLNLLIYVVWNCHSKLGFHREHCRRLLSEKLYGLYSVLERNPDVLLTLSKSSPRFHAATPLSNSFHLFLPNPYFLQIEIPFKMRVPCHLIMCCLFTSMPTSPEWEYLQFERSPIMKNEIKLFFSRSIGSTLCWSRLPIYISRLREKPKTMSNCIVDVFTRIWFKPFRHFCSGVLTRAVSRLPYLFFSWC